MNELCQNMASTDHCCFFMLFFLLQKRKRSTFKEEHNRLQKALENKASATLSLTFCGEGSETTEGPTQTNNEVNIMLTYRGRRTNFISNLVGD